MNGGPRSIQRRRKEKGFTLIELMVVVAIIAILASIGIPKMNAFIRTAETAEATAQFGRVVEASSGWRTLHNDNLTAFNGTLNVTNGTPGGTLMGKVPHLQLASDAKWTYVITSNATAFCINATKDGSQVWYSSTDKSGTDGWDDGHVNKVGYVTNDTAYNAGCAP